MTPHDAVSFIRKQLKVKSRPYRNLDLVLPVFSLFVGKATRLAEYLLARPKSYRAEITLGVATDTQDAYGRVLSEKDCSIFQRKSFKSLL